MSALGDRGVPIYRYRAVTAQGSEVTGEVVASGQAAARAQLSEQSLLLRRLSRRFSMAILEDRVTPMLFFVQAFQSLLAAGLEVVEALEISTRRLRSGVLRHSLEQVLEDVRAGHALADAFARHARLHDSLWLATLRAGQASGRLSAAVAGYEQHLTRTLELRRKVMGTLAYPLILAVMVTLVLGVLVMVVIPKLQAGYASLGGELPLLTQILMTCTEVAPWLALFLAGAGICGWWWVRKRLAKIDQWRLYSRVIHRVPFLGTVQREIQTINLTGTLGLLLAAAFPVHRALEFVAEGEPNLDLAHRLRSAGVDVAAGKSVTEALARERLLPDSALQLLEIGERSGQLQAMLEKIAGFYKGELEASIQRFVTVAQPLLMLVIGLVIGLVVVAVYLPIFSLTQVLQ